MAENIVTNATSNSGQTGVIIQDETDWGLIGGSINSLTNIVVSLYGTSLVAPLTSYTLTSTEEQSYVDNGLIDLSFDELNGNAYLDDGWYSVQIETNSGDYISNYSGFGIYAEITFAVFNLINSLHVPENVKYDSERYCVMAMWLEGLKYLDTTNVNSRDIKFKKRLLSLQRMLLIV